jgi:hypothetical protein
VVVRQEDLLAAGIDWSGADRDRLRLTRGGQPVPVWHEGPQQVGPGTRIGFLARAIEDSLYTRTAVYRLALADAVQRGLATVHAPPGSGAARTSVRDVWTHAPNRLYAPYSPTTDPWYAAEVYRDGGSSGSLQESFAIPPKSPVSSNERLTVRLWGGTVYPQAPDHSVRLLLNGVEVAVTTFDGLNQAVVEAPLPPGVLQSGSNTLTIELLNDTGVEYDLVMLESIEVEYEREMLAQGDRFSFELSPGSDNSAVHDRIFASEFDDLGRPARRRRIARGTASADSQPLRCVSCANAQARSSCSVEPWFPGLRRRSRWSSPVPARLGIVTGSSPRTAESWRSCSRRLPGTIHCRVARGTTSSSRIRASSRAWHR